MPADGFTKPLNRQQFERFRSMLDLVDLRTLEFYHSITKTIGPTTDRDPDTEYTEAVVHTTSNATPKDLPRLGQRSQRAKVEEQAMKHY
ncbi:hypothetical protein E4U44_001299 [Claviceps purpurea]|nr:hypothetical protein E4U44_001299 [Claviceps purpurea]